MDPHTFSRRSFLKLSLTASGLVLGLRLAPTAAATTDTGADLAGFHPNAWIQVDRYNTITFFIDKSEMGQGVMTSLSMILAEELEADIHVVKTRFAPAERVYANKLFGVQATGGSTSIPSSWENLRTMGATARALFAAAAAQTWKVPLAECEARNGSIHHDQSGRTLKYGDLIQLAAGLKPPEQVALKSPEQFRLIGKPVHRLDTPAKVDGSAIYGIDVKVEGMVNATIKHPPVFGTRALSVDDSASRAVAGVIDIFTLEAGVVVVADTFWHAKKAADLLQVTWSKAEGEAVSSDGIMRHASGLARKSGSSLRSDGHAERVLKAAGNTALTAVYQLPYQAHATMEPMNCTVHLQAERCEVWVGTQSQGPTHAAVVQITGLDPGQVQVHTTYLGGGFGRRGEVDFVVEAVQVAQRVQRPVKLVWSREEDMQHDYYRPASYHLLSGALDQGRPSAWSHRIVGASIMERAVPGYVPAILPDWVPRPFKSFGSWVAGGVIALVNDSTLTEGAANHPYAIDHVEVDLVTADPGVPIGFWRSVGHSSNAFVVESFIDELAHQAQADPYRFRRDLLAAHPRHLGVLDLAAQRAGWGQALPERHGRGIAVHESFNSYAAQVAEVEVDEGGRVRVTRVVCAVDCGLVINPDTVVAQIEGAIAYGLTATLKGAITLKEGRVQQSNFHDFPILRIGEMPEVEVHIVPSREPPTGVGEPGVPLIAPAVANAIYAAIGRRVRKLPITPGDLA